MSVPTRLQRRHHYILNLKLMYSLSPCSLHLWFSILSSHRWKFQVLNSLSTREVVQLATLLSSSHGSISKPLDETLETTNELSKGPLAMFMRFKEHFIRQQNFFRKKIETTLRNKVISPFLHVIFPSCYWYAAAVVNYYSLCSNIIVFFYKLNSIMVIGVFIWTAYYLWSKWVCRQTEKLCGFQKPVHTCKLFR